MDKFFAIGRKTSGIVLTGKTVAVRALFAYSFIEVNIIDAVPDEKRTRF